MINIEFKSILQLVKAFPDEQTCINHLELLRWNGNVISPFDSTSKVYKCAGNKYKCKNTGKYFNVRTQTLFDNTKVPLQKWFMAIYLITAHKKGISSLQLGRDIDVTQKTAWFMNHRIRNCYGITGSDDSGEPMGGEGVVVEVDETYLGGKVKNMHNSKRKAILEANEGPTANKTGVMGYLERGGKIRLQVMDANIPVAEYLTGTVSKDSVLMTDKNQAYKNIGKEYAFHGTTDHSKSEYVKDKVIHTNSIEGAFSMLDRMVIGIYHYISPKHTQKYLNELSFRYNSRDINNGQRFTLMLLNGGHRLTYKNLIAK